MSVVFFLFDFLVKITIIKFTIVVFYFIYFDFLNSFK